jgi:hypothetical protein
MDYKKWFEESLSAEQKAAVLDYQGGFSDNVAWCDEFHEYVNSHCIAGYIGSDGRSKARDRVVETVLREVGLGDRGIALWLTSTSGRHLMDDPPRGSKEAFVKYVIEYTKNAFKDVVVWSHPDHKGTLASTLDLRKKIWGE